MVKELKNIEGVLFQCEECDLQYHEREWAEKCEAWCREHHTCNLEIIAHAVEIKKYDE